MTDIRADIRIDPRSTTPPFEQVRVQLLTQMQDGTLPAGTRLAPVRQLAAELNVAAGTVARAYKELEESGAVETRGRGGTVVAWSTDAAERRIEMLAAQLASAAREERVSAARALEIVTRALGA
ncbi:GntR family transcriptional regulator [Salinibacterium sp. ZJ70]|uniref:GntR family transcriptional regulator n=1 Tax=Salinibacterium sp. ZJ70 TaxID=2708084 RepID=UPI00142176B4|nr:GntR family transcriptional regulator [Salinibacterium sp. ZJ70]